MSNTRNITATVAFIATFIFSAGLIRIIFPAPAVQYVYVDKPQYTGCKARAIESFIRQDNINGEIHSSKITGLQNLDSQSYISANADATLEYYNSSSSMDVSQFPQDFQNAWREHMKAWRDYSDFLNQMKNSSARKNLSGDDFGLAEQRFNSEINRTFNEVLRIGRNYGADVE
ncbi:MAG: hypothetical protein ABJA66_10800 [Actinomycetota bacterium]